MKWEKFLSGSNDRQRSFLSEIKETVVSTESTLPLSDVTANVRSIDQSQMTNQFVEILVGAFAKVSDKLLTLPDDLDKSLIELGLDSLTSIEFRSRVKQKLDRDLGSQLPATLVFDYPSIRRICQFLVERAVLLEEKKSATGSPVSNGKKKTSDGSVRSDIHEQNDKNEIAIIGASCRFPGGANDLAAYWQIYRKGISAISIVPEDRWHVNDHYSTDPDAPGKIVTKFAGFLDNVKEFDNEFFEMSLREASEIDPQQRIMLEIVWESLEHAGIAPRSLQGSNVGVFVGASNYDYHRIHDRARLSDPSGYYCIGTNPPAIAGRISYFFGFQGPSFVIDAACSSSLIAIHQASMSLRSGESNLALAGGVNLILDPALSVSVSHARMLSPDGRCFTFDERANGYVRAEGAGVVVLKRIADAIKDRDRILAVIKGSAVNQDGRSAGLTAPNGPAQEALIRQSLANAGVKPSQVGYFETHGTGTSLGDPIEVRAIGQAFQSNDPRSTPLFLGSHKANIGHAEPAAGIAGVLKVIAALQAGEIPPQINFEKLNPKLNLAEIPAQIPTELQSWNPIAGRRIACVSAFGFTGSNANIVLEEAPKSARPSSETSQPFQLFAISARSKESLASLIQKYVDFLERNESVDLGDICYTAGIGRHTFRFRYAVLCASVFDLKAKLSDFLSGRSTVKGSLSPLSKVGKMAFLIGEGFPCDHQNLQVLYNKRVVFKEKFDSYLSEFGQNEISNVKAWMNGDGGGVLSAFEKAIAVFSSSLAFVNLLLDIDCRADIVLAQGCGEIVAAVTSGFLPLALAAEVLKSTFSEAERVNTNRSVFVNDIDPGPVKAQPGSIKWLSLVTGNLMQTMEPDHWVKFAKDFGTHQTPIRRVEEEAIDTIVLWGVSRQEVETLRSLTSTALVAVSADQGNVWSDLLEVVAENFRTGHSIPWTKLEMVVRERISLPTYSFEKQECWIQPNSALQLAAKLKG